MCGRAGKQPAVVRGLGAFAGEEGMMGWEWGFVWQCVRVAVAKLGGDGPWLIHVRGGAHC